MSDQETITSSYHPYTMMHEHPHTLDHLEMEFRWGDYMFRVIKCHLTTFEPSKKVNFHKHAEYEFHFIPHGRGTVILEGETFELCEGLFYLTGPDVMHYQEADARIEMAELCLHIDIVETDSSFIQISEQEKLEARECVQKLRLLPLRTAQDTFKAMNWFLTAYQSWYEQDPFFYTTFKMAVIQILTRSARAFSIHTVNTDRLSIPPRDMNQYRFEFAAAFIKANYAHGLTLEEVAEKLDISGRQLQRVFLDQGVGSFRDYVQNIRLKHVCESLGSQDQSIEKIASLHGFSSSNYLYHVFKKKFGMTPREYQLKNMRTSNEEHENMTKYREM